MFDVEKFIEDCKLANHSVEMENEGKHFRYIVDDMGSARLLYHTIRRGFSPLTSSMDAADFAPLYGLVGVIANNNLYVIAPVAFDLPLLDVPDNVPHLISYDSFVDECNEYLKNVAFPKYFSSLNIKGDAAFADDTFSDGTLIGDARQYLLGDESVLYPPLLRKNRINKSIALNVLCNIISIEEVCENELSHYSKYYTYHKHHIEAVKNFLSTKNVDEIAKKWEIEMAKAILSSKAHTVNIILCNENGKTKSLKANATDLRTAIYTKEHILGVLDGNDYVYAKDIKEITYRKKVIFER